MLWVKDYTDSDHHPQLLKAGFWGRVVFKALCRLSGKHNWAGHIPKAYLDADYLVAYLEMPDGVEYDEEFEQSVAVPARLNALNAVAKLHAAGVLISEAAGSHIDGWERKQPSATPEAERSRRFRDKENAIATYVSPIATHANGSVTDPNLDIDIEVEREVEESKTTTSAASAAAVSVLEAYRLKLQKPKARMTDGKRRLVAARMKQGFTLEDLCLVPDGVNLDPWDERVNHNSFEVIYREGNVEKFLEIARNGPPRVAPPPPRRMPAEGIMRSPQRSEWDEMEAARLRGGNAG